MELVEKDADFLDDPAPRVMATQLNDYNVVLELQAWIRDERQHVEKRSELRERAYNTLLKAGVEMPFQTLQLAPLQVEVVPR
jgi:small conductance mechanosensitive channel